MVSTRRNYSTGEMKLIGILRANSGSPMSSKNIAKAHYPPGKSPVNAVRSVVTILNSAININKNRRSKDCFTIMKTDRRGPFPIEFWIEKRSTSRRGSRESSSERPSRSSKTEEPSLS
jgi:hypothetical protein